VSALPVESATPVVSVVVPTYNRAPVLRRLLEALAECDVPAGGLEVVVVDDGSRDDTAGVVRASPIPVEYLHQRNAGPAAARNRGWRHARGALIAFTDDDCVPSRRWLVDIVAAFEGVDVAGAGGRVESLVPGFLAGFVQAERLVGHGGGAGQVGYLVTANAVYRRSVLEVVGGFDERFPGAAGEDTDLTMRVAEQGLRLTVLDDAVVAHDHRTTLLGLVRTYRRHGEARHLLRRLHPEAAFGAKAARMTTPAHWHARYVYYRAEGATRIAALVYCGLRAVGLVAYGSGLVRAALRDGR
jgi:glycosyltransferase involved in cell wall biosynthesis